MGAGGGQVVGAARQRLREPQQPAVRIGDYLHVHPVPTVLDAPMFVKLRSSGSLKYQAADGA